MTNSGTVIAEQAHKIASHRSLAKLLEWGKEFMQQELAQGRRVIWAPCHALGRSLSLRSWVIQKASEMLGNSAPADAPTLLSGATDTLIIADASLADRESLNWLGELLACAQEVRGLTATPPLPKLVVLLPLKNTLSDAVSEFTNRLYDLGSEDEKLGGKESDFTSIEIDGVLRGLPLSNQEFLAAVAIAPFPLTRAEYAALAQAAKAADAECAALLESPLFAEISGEIVPVCAEIRERMRAPLAPEALTRGAKLLLHVCDARLALLPDAAIELYARAGDQKQAAKLAKRRVADHEAAGRYSEAMRIMRQGRDQGFAIEGSLELDEARTAYLAALVGEFMLARELVKPLQRRRNQFEDPVFVESLAMAMRTLAMKDGFEPRMADSLMRRAIRMNKGDIDQHVRLLVLRVSLLRSNAFTLDERADWLLTHVNQKTLAMCSPTTIALYLEETGKQLAAEGIYKRAFKRLRRMISIAGSDQQLAGALITMARCRVHFKDHEGAMRFASGALQYALRCANLGLVKEAATLLREKPALEQPKVRKKDKEKAKVRPNVVELPTRVVAQPEQMFEILARRFGITRWARRRGTQLDTFGKDGGVRPDNTAVYEEQGGQVRSITNTGAEGRARALVLLRQDGDDFVQFSSDSSTEVTDDSVVRFLLSDKENSPVTDLEVAPLRKNVVDEYMRRAATQPSRRGLHHAIETMFNKDLLMYLEDQGLNKEDMASHLGVSRATLYRMYARAGLN
ncbi:MAG: hypothetical protein KBG84_02060 [Planctomycetes bacterium]|nr:hypothetical protein [Planctomycetota bacterium]